MSSKIPGEWESSERPLLFELQITVPNKDGISKVLMIEQSPDEGAVRLAFGAVRKVLEQLEPRPKASLALYFGSVALDVFLQTKEGEELEP